jgi:uncharacterized protein YkvS
MPKITFRWNWQPDQPSNLHCGHCGHQMTITPSADDLKAGFFEWYCVRCGTCWNYGTKPKPVEPTVEPTREDIDIPVSLGYPQTRRLFERHRASAWLALMVGSDVLDHQKISTIATKLKSYYRTRFGCNPPKTDSYNSYSGIELNACMERMYVADKPLAEELQTLHLEKIRREADVGCIIFGNNGIAREVVKIVDNSLILDFDGILKRVDRSSVMSIIQLDPTKNF